MGNESDNGLRVSSASRDVIMGTMMVEVGIVGAAVARSGVLDVARADYRGDYFSSENNGQTEGTRFVNFANLNKRVERGYLKFAFGSAVFAFCLTDVLARITFGGRGMWQMASEKWSAPSWSPDTFGPINP